MAGSTEATKIHEYVVPLITSPAGPHACPTCPAHPPACRPAWLHVSARLCLALLGWLRPDLARPGSGRDLFRLTEFAVAQAWPGPAGPGRGQPGPGPAPKVVVLCG